ncbi:MAG: hypothetical protein JNN30_11660 [Rhodanobacteraceae bacterium]|nr:hypothetical protein [Rhodanobacteraceae bacterium]
MRSLLILIAGALIGALVTFSMANALHQRNAWQRGVMNLLQHHLGELRRLQRTGSCSATLTAPHLLRMAQTSADISPSRPNEKPDYHAQAQRFLSLNHRLATEAPSACPDLDAALQEIGNACQDCHRDYR